MALELGYAYAGPGLYRHPDGFLTNAQGMLTDAPHCGGCNDNLFVKMRPQGRGSKGPWDAQLVPCECQRGEPEPRNTWQAQREAGAHTVGQFLAKLAARLLPPRRRALVVG